MRRTLFPLVMALLLFATASAQSLNRLAPAESVLTLGIGPHDSAASALLEELATLDWSQAGETLQRTIAYVAASEGGDMGMFFGPGLSDMLAEECPPLADAWDGGLRALVGEEALLSVSVSPFNPLPAVTGITRYDDEGAARAARIQEAFIACEEEFSDGDMLTLEQDGVTLYVIGDASDLPLILGNIDNLYFFSTNPETARGVVRRAMGANEPSFADSSLGALMEESLSSEGLSISFNLSILADLAEGFAGFFVDDPELALLVERGLGFLRTLEGVAGTVRTTDEGLLFESVLSVNPEGGDPQLAELLLCPDCTLSADIIAPNTALSVMGQYFSPRRAFDYLQSWLDTAEGAIGERINLREVLLQELGFDIDAALLNWLGDEFYWVQLEPLSSDLATLIYQPAQVVLVPVTSEAAARDGLAILSSYLPVIGALIAEEDPDFAGDLSGMVASDSYVYEGVEIERHRFGPTMNVGLAYVGDFLVIGSPSYALEWLVDVSVGKLGSLSDNPDYQAALEAASAGVISFNYSDSRRQTLALADLAALGSQPLAFIITAAMQAAEERTSWEDDWGFEEDRDFDDWDFEEDWGYTDLTGAMPVTVEVPTVIQGSLSADDQSTVYYTLTDLPGGEAVMVTMDSDDFDTYLYLYDAATGNLVAENDDYQGSLSRSRVYFTPEEGVTYWVGVSSYMQRGSGAYTVIAEAADEEATTDSFSFPSSLPDLTPLPLPFAESVSGVLESSATDGVSNYYELAGLVPGAEVTVTVESQDFDTYLYLIDAGTERIITANDDFPDTTRSQVSFSADAGVTYWVEVSSYRGNETGAYTLTIATSPETPGEMPTETPGEDVTEEWPEDDWDDWTMPEVERPTFTELLQLTDILPQALFIISDRLSYSEGYSEVRENSIYSRMLVRIDW